MCINLANLSKKEIDLTSSEKHILLILCLHADPKTHLCWPSLSSIIQDSGYSETHVGRIMKSLRDKNKIISTNKLTGKTKRTKIYKVNLNTPTQGGINKLNTPICDANTPMEGGIKYPHTVDMERKVFKEKGKKDFALKNPLKAVLDHLKK